MRTQFTCVLFCRCGLNGLRSVATSQGYVEGVELGSWAESANALRWDSHAYQVGSVVIEPQAVTLLNAFTSRLGREGHHTHVRSL